MEIERVRRDFLCNTTQALKMEASFDETNERECSVCFFDLHLSAAGCRQCSPDKYSCLNHAKQFCSCVWGSKFFLLRHDIKDLAILVEALEGKLSAIYRWAKLDLGLSLSSYVSKDNKQPGSVSEPPTEEQKGQETVQDLLKSKESSISHESSRKDVILLSDDEGDDSSKPLKQVVKSEVQVKNDTDSSTKPQDLMVMKGSSSVMEVPKNDEKVVIIGLYAKSGQGNNTQTNSGKQKGPQKGPRMAKVVRRISCNVEPLEYGVVQAGKLWCDNRAIYPKGTIVTTSIIVV